MKLSSSIVPFKVSKTDVKYEEEVLYSTELQHDIAVKLVAGILGFIMFMVAVVCVYFCCFTQKRRCFKNWEHSLAVMCYQYLQKIETNWPKTGLKEFIHRLCFVNKYLLIDKISPDIF